MSRSSVKTFFDDLNPSVPPVYIICHICGSESFVAANGKSKFELFHKFSTSYNSPANFVKEKKLIKIK